MEARTAATQQCALIASGYTSCCAAEAGSLPLVQQLMERGANVHAQTTSRVIGPAHGDGGTVIYFSCFFPDMEAFFLSCGLKSAEYEWLELMIAYAERWLVPESELPADPEQRRSAISMERNSDWQAESAEYRSQLRLREAAAPSGSGSMSKAAVVGQAAAASQAVTVCARVTKYLAAARM